MLYKAKGIKELNQDNFGYHFSLREMTGLINTSSWPLSINVHTVTALLNAHSAPDLKNSINHINVWVTFPSNILSNEPFINEGVGDGDGGGGERLESIYHEFTFTRHVIMLLLHPIINQPCARHTFTQW
jgi:hypothetical protein